MVKTAKKTDKKNTKRKTSSPKRKKSGKKSSVFWRLFKFLLITGVLAFLLLGSYVFYCYITLPDIQKAVNRTREPSTVIMAENGNDIAKFGHVYASVISDKKLPKNLTDAVVAIEDRRFYKHFGFDVFGFARAALTNVFRKRYAQGASTITQQVAKNIFLTPSKTVKRKVQELLLALWLEQKMTKDQIMAIYLNRVYFGSGNYGAEAAANWYFNKSVYDLNLREAAILAGMLKAPTRYNPILQRQNALKRAEVVLGNMRKYGFIGDEMYKRALQMPISDGQKYRVSGGKHFAQYVYNRVNSTLGERTDDVRVITTLDQNLQETAEKILRAKISAAEGQNVTEGTVVILDMDGAIKAMVGGVDYNRSQFNRATQAKRQAGSSFKPFVYLTALQYGFAPDSIINDAPITVGKWKPENYTKHYYGNVTLTYALANSLNAATVALSRELYLKDIAANAHKAGITTDISLAPSMVLGTNEVKIIDMAAAYTAIANGGYAVTPYAINEIETYDNKQMYVRQAEAKKQVFDAKITRQMSIMMEQVINSGTGKRAKLPIFAAGKTGTSQEYRDAWFIGWTNKYIAAVWVGNDNDKPMNKVGGGNLPAEIWHDIMLTTVKDTPAYSVNTQAESADAIGNLIGDSTDGVSDEIGELIESEETSANDSPQNMEDLLNRI